jgi:hypothetical protein
MTTKRKIVIAVVIWAALAMVPPAANADRAMDDQEIAFITCGHLGIPCPPEGKPAKKCQRATAAKARRGRCRSGPRHRKASRASRPRHSRT